MILNMIMWVFEMKNRLGEDSAVFRLGKCVHWEDPMMDFGNLIRTIGPRAEDLSL